MKHALGGLALMVTLGTSGMAQLAHLPPQLSISDAVVREPDTGTATITFQVTVKGPQTETIIVDWRTVDFTATAGLDYEYRSGQLVFDPTQLEEQSAVIGIVVHSDDVMYEGSENFFVDLSPPANAVLDKPRGHGAIEDADSAGIRAKCDFNGDGRSEILTVREKPHTPPSPAPPGDDPTITHIKDHFIWGITGTQTSLMSDITTDKWAARATEDFDGDGGCDVFWEHDDQSLAVTLIPPGHPLRAPRDEDRITNPHPGAVIVGSGDLTGDGRADVLWWDGQRDELEIWHSYSGDHPRHDRPRTWQQERHRGEPGATAVAVANLDGRDAPEIVWRHSSGALTYWRMTESQPLPAGDLVPGMAPAGAWAIMAAGDFNGDGYDDLLWYNPTHHRNVVWLMRDAVRINGSFLSPVTFEKSQLVQEVTGPR